MRIGGDEKGGKRMVRIGMRIHEFGYSSWSREGSLMVAVAVMPSMHDARAIK